MGTLKNALHAWGPITLGTEIDHTNRASRTWHAVLDDRPVVVKLTFDGPPYVEPGLRVAEYVQTSTGVLTGKPIRCLAGNLSTPLDNHTLAVLDFVDGTPLLSFDNVGAAAAGRLLAIVHSATSLTAVPEVPARVLDWFAHAVGGDDVLAAVASVRASDLTYGVIYGDPSPEILRLTPGPGLGLIDWGTPSFGPLVYDVATWQSFIASRASSPSAGPSFLAAYQDSGLLGLAEYDAFAACDVLLQALSR